MLSLFLYRLWHIFMSKIVTPLNKSLYLLKVRCDADNSSVIQEFKNKITRCGCLCSHSCTKWKKTGEPEVLLSFWIWVLRACYLSWHFASFLYVPLFVSCRYAISFLLHCTIFTACDSASDVQIHFLSPSSVHVTAGHCCDILYKLLPISENVNVFAHRAGHFFIITWDRMLLFLAVFLRGRKAKLKF